MRTLREHRYDKLMGIHDLARQAGVSHQTIVSIEKGRRQPRFKTIRRIAEALGVDPHEVAEFHEVLSNVPREPNDDPAH